MRPAFLLRAPQNGTEYHIFAQPPDAASSGAGPWTTVLFLDGDDQFEAARTAAGHAQAERPLLPLLLVGIGYGASYIKPGNRRTRDYTPTRLAEEPGSGGAAAFTAFLMDTLWPEIDSRYPVTAGARAIAGHSLGSLFALHLLFGPTPFFQRYLISSPSIWWDNRAVLCQGRRLREQQEQLEAQVYLSVGAEDTASMTGDFDLLTDQLEDRPFSGLATTVERLKGFDHYNALSEAFRRGLLALFSHSIGR